jgi:hypothetical protein
MSLKSIIILIVNHYFFIIGLAIEIYKFLLTFQLKAFAA